MKSNNMGIFNKKKKEKLKEQEQIKEAVRKKYSDEISENVIFHVMPKKFHLDNEKADSAKIAGVLIILGGIIFLLILSFAFYWVIFKMSAQPTDTILPETAIENKKDEEASETKPEEKTEIIPEENLIIEEEEPDEELIPEEDPIVEPEEVEIATSTPEISLLMGDSDGDGLMDREELIFGTDPEKSDTDGDTYNDLTEILNLYNPAGSGSIAENAGISKHENNNYNYNFLYPAKWEKKSVGGEDSLIFKAPDDHFISVIVQPNPDLKNIQEWYSVQFPSETISEDSVINGQGWAGIVKTETNILYLCDNEYNYIISVSYSTGGENQAIYKNIFDLAVKTFKIGD